MRDTGEAALAAVLSRAALVQDFDVRSRLSAILHPILLIQSEGEGAVSSQCHDELASGLPNAKSEWLHSCGHIPYLTHPHRVAKLVQTFFLE